MLICLYQDMEQDKYKHKSEKGHVGLFVFSFSFTGFGWRGSSKEEYNIREVFLGAREGIL